MLERFTKIFCYHSNWQCNNIINDSLPAIISAQDIWCIHSLQVLKDRGWIQLSPPANYICEPWSRRKDGTLLRSQPRHASLECSSIPQPAGERELLPHHRTQSHLHSWAASSQFARGLQLLKVEKMGWDGKHSCHTDLSAKCQLKSWKHSPGKPVIFLTEL